MSGKLQFFSWKKTPWRYTSPISGGVNPEQRLAEVHQSFEIRAIEIEPMIALSHGRLETRSLLCLKLKTATEDEKDVWR